MANEWRLINSYVAEKSIRDAEKNIRSEITCDYDTGWADALSSVADLIKRMPTVDAVEVVRCKDCKLEGTEKCPMVHRDLLFGNLYAETKPDAFCSYGERRTNE